MGNVGETSFYKSTLGKTKLERCLRPALGPHSLSSERVLSFHNKPSAPTLWEEAGWVQSV